MAPTPTGTAFCIACPRVRSSRAVSAMVKAPAAASAEYSPSEWPATNCASRLRSRPASASSTRRVASETAISAGWAFSVSVSVSAGPSNMMALSLAAERLVHLVEHLPGGREACRQRLAHADRLAALARKHESDRHAPSQSRLFAGIGPKDTAGRVLSSYARSGNEAKRLNRYAGFLLPIRLVS